MKKALNKIAPPLWHYSLDGSKVAGTHSDIGGDCTGLRANLDKLEISDEERAAGVAIRAMVAGE